MVSTSSILIWVFIPIINFFIWFHIGNNRTIKCDKIVLENAIYAQTADFEVPCIEDEGVSQCSKNVDLNDPYTLLEYSNTRDFDAFRDQHLAPMNFKAGVLRFYDPTVAKTIVVRRKAEEECTHVYHQYAHERNPVNTCHAIVRFQNITGALPALRYDQDVDEGGMALSSKRFEKMKKLHPELIFKGNRHNSENLRPSGFFRTVPGVNGRKRVDEKMAPFLRFFDGPTGIEEELKNKLNLNKIKKGDDLIIMVVNEGEIDLYLNFACSCKANNLDLKKVFVFAASSEIITVIESTGAMGIYHEGYSSVSKKASEDYLDRVFVDMMWYKAFSIYLILKMDINVLFQDVDLVWFKDPFPYFHDFNKNNEKSTEIDGFFSDDGQRSLRYAPFYANSGFYYLKASERTVYFAWSIMISFDIVQVLGSHQNVFTMKLIEGFAMSASRSKLLSLEEFPTGILYHHDLGYMKKLADHEVHPYNYHMCWTEGKPEKLIYLRNVKMWYLSETCSVHDNLRPDGKIFESVSDKVIHNNDIRWEHLSSLCCTVMDGAPY